MVLPENIKCVIFDLDGTLAKFPIDYKSMRAELRKIFNTDSKFKPLIPEIKKYDEKRGYEVVDKYELASVSKAVLMDEVIDLYKKSFDRKVVILTRNGKKMVKLFLKNFNLPLPHLIVSRDDVSELKPNKAHLQPVFAKFGFKKEEYILIGDSKHDEELADNVGIDFINIDNNLERIANNHNYGEGFNGILMDYRFKAFRRFLGVNKSILELGPAEGHMTRKLVEITNDLTVVDGSGIFLKRLKLKYPYINTIHSYFENMNLEKKFDIILLCHILEHVNNPVKILSFLKRNMHESTKIIVTVPNAYSIHRLLGVEMGLLKDVHELNSSDLKVGHRRVYDFDLLIDDCKKAGLKVIHKQGIFLKPFSNSQLEKFPRKVWEGLYKLGDKFPNNCAELLLVCQNQ